jgi:hypothetical protein
VIERLIDLATHFLKHHFWINLIAVAVIGLVMILLVLIPSSRSACFEVDTEAIGKIRLSCEPVQATTQSDLADGLQGDTYTDRRSGFAVKVEPPDGWSIISARETVDKTGKPAETLTLPMGLSGIPATFYTDDAAAVFVSKEKIQGGHTNFWIFRIPGRLDEVDRFIVDETKRLLRTGTAVFVYMLSLLNDPDSLARQSQAFAKCTGRPQERIVLSRVVISPDHTGAVLEWDAPYCGLDADLVARVVLGTRDVYYVAAIRLKPVGRGDQKLNDALRRMMESFRIF